MWTSKPDWGNVVSEVEEAELTPQTKLSFQCDCGKSINPNTNSFRVLCNQARDSGWLIQYHDDVYEVYCPDCKAGVAVK